MKSRSPNTSPKVRWSKEDLQRFTDNPGTVVTARAVYVPRSKYTPTIEDAKRQRRQ